jgi:nucleoside 2-deoxyribosyltransferase
MQEHITIYLAGPLFTRAEINFNKELAELLGKDQYRVLLPQEQCKGLSVPKDIFDRCKADIEQASLLIAILDGAEVDSGTAFEVGYAYAQNIPVIGLRTDFRGAGEDQGLNIMLTQSCTHILMVSLESRQNNEQCTYISLADNYYSSLKNIIKKITT